VPDAVRAFIKVLHAPTRMARYHGDGGSASVMCTDYANAMTTPCPHCHEVLRPPRITATQYPGEIPFHAQQNCPGCDRPLIYTTEGQLSHRWRPDRTRECVPELEAIGDQRVVLSRRR